VPWYLLAAIGRVESHHGRFGGSRLLPNGDGTRPIRGIPLDGRPGIALIRDTDNGVLDDDTTYDRAVGPMQFIPSTWRGVQVDGNRDGRRDPNNIFDAALGAAGYLCSGPGNLRDPAQQRAALRRYNHIDEYGRVVLSVAAEYADQSAGEPRVPLPMPVPRPAPDPAPPGRPTPPTTTAPRPTPPAPAPPTTRPPAPAPPTTVAPTPPTTAAPTPPTDAPDPTDPDGPDVPDTPDGPDTPDAPDVPTDPEVPVDPSEGVPTDPSHDDEPADPQLPPAAVGWSGTMLDFVTETLSERPDCAAGPDGSIEVPAPATGDPAAPRDCPPPAAASGEGAVGPLAGGPVAVPASAVVTRAPESGATGCTTACLPPHPSGVALIA
jgi:hypothetical protein